jgi:surface carbohydrate biosynthesis protein (TIGR04326 family)
MKQDRPPVKRHIIVCPPRKSCIFKALRQLKGKNFRWAYLGEDITHFIAVARQVEDAGERIEIGDKLQDIAQSLRQAYIDYVGKLSITNNSLMWWVGSLSEKNPYVSRTFLYACYVKLCQAIVNSSRNENLVFIGENKAIRQCITANLINSPHHNIQRIEAPVREFCYSFKDASRLACLKAYFLARTIFHVCLARRYRIKAMSPYKEGLTLIHNWVDLRSFNDKGEYRDTYLGGLADHLKSKGKKVFIVPYILNTASYRQTLKKLERSLNSFLLAESYLTVGDVCRVFLKMLRNVPRKRYFPAFEGIKVSSIIMNDQWKDWAGNSPASNLLLYEAVRRWKNAGVPIETFIYTYENQVWEKAYCLAFRKFYPLTKIIGYQHTNVPKMLLLYFFAKEELPILPFPDKVITAGKHTANLLKASGYDPTKVISGGAIRYESLLSKKAAAVKKDVANPVILVTLSADKNETIELVWKVLQAFGQMKQYKIVFKLHPVCPYRLIVKEIGSLPEHFTIADRPVGDLLRESNVLLYSSSTTSIEAIASGIPILQVKSDFTIDRDNLADFPAAIRESVSTPQAILQATASLLKMDEQELSRKKQLWSRVVAEMFGPVDESTFDLFL